MKTLFFAGMMALLPALAFADASLAGHWVSDDLGERVQIIMDMKANGHWSSQTRQNTTVLATISGLYTQIKQTENSGKLVFTPTHSDVSAQHGAAKIEHDDYRLAEDHSKLTLSTYGDVVVFHRQ